MSVYIDLETGGLDPRRNQIFSIGLVIEGDRTEEYLIPVAYDPRKYADPGALRVNGIDLSRWEGYPLDKALERVRELVSGRFIAHNASFDRGFFEAACIEAGVEIPGSWGCTLDWSRRIPALRSLPSRKLAVLHEHLVGFCPSSSHEALEDARSCMRIAHALSRIDPEEQYLRVR